jgi:ketosteroid isomerase-like protein
MPVKEHVVEEAALKPSAEMQELMARFYQAASTDDFENLDRLISKQAGVLWIGTDPDEWWAGPEAVLKAWRTQSAEMGGPVRITGGTATAYRHGDIAWVSDRPTFHLKDGRMVPFRFTAVWRRESEGWRIVQAHASLGVANEAALQTA